MQSLIETVEGCGKLYKLLILKGKEKLRKGIDYKGVIEDD